MFFEEGVETLVYRPVSYMEMIITSKHNECKRKKKTCSDSTTGPKENAAEKNRKISAETYSHYPQQKNANASFSWNRTCSLGNFNLYQNENMIDKKASHSRLTDFRQLVKRTLVRSTSSDTDHLSSKINRISTKTFDETYKQRRKRSQSTSSFLYQKGNRNVRLTSQQSLKEYFEHVSCPIYRHHAENLTSYPKRDKYHENSVTHDESSCSEDSIPSPTLNHSSSSSILDDVDCYAYSDCGLNKESNENTLTKDSVLHEKLLRSFSIESICSHHTIRTTTSGYLSDNDILSDDSWNHIKISPDIKYKKRYSKRRTKSFDDLLSHRSSTLPNDQLRKRKTGVCKERAEFPRSVSEAHDLKRLEMSIAEYNELQDCTYEDKLGVFATIPKQKNTLFRRFLHKKSKKKGGKKLLERLFEPIIDQNFNIVGNAPQRRVLLESLI